VIGNTAAFRESCARMLRVSQTRYKSIFVFKTLSGFAKRNVKKQRIVRPLNF
jgi:hypothetical protein